MSVNSKRETTVQRKSTSLRLVDFPVGLQTFLRKVKLQNYCKRWTFWGIVKMIFWLVPHSKSLPKGQAWKFVFFEPWNKSWTKLLYTVKQYPSEWVLKPSLGGWVQTCVHSGQPQESDQSQHPSPLSLFLESNAQSHHCPLCEDPSH